MILSVCAALIQELADAGRDESTAVMRVHAYISSLQLPQHEFDYAMSEVRSIAAKIYETALVE